MVGITKKHNGQCLLGHLYIYQYQNIKKTGSETTELQLKTCQNMYKNVHFEQIFKISLSIDW